MYLVIDIGNTNQKAAFFDEEGHLIDVLNKKVFSTIDLENWLEKYAVKTAIFSSVGNYDERFFNLLQLTMPTITFSQHLNLPIEIDYESLETLGTDRIANAVGANAMFPNKNVLSIQLGSCLVTDMVNSENKYLGGTIAPGLRMRFQALQHFTAKLPLIEPQKTDFIIGNTTESSMQSGVFSGMACEIEGLINQYRGTFQDLEVVLTGGDGPLFEGLLKNSIFAAPNLVLLGLYKILRLNALE